MPLKFQADWQSRETHVRLQGQFPGQGRVDIQTPDALFTHFLHALSFYAEWDFQCHTVSRDGIYHHFIEDTGIALGNALREALQTAGPVTRFAHQVVPMDEALVLVAMDLSGRAGLFMRRVPTHEVTEFYAGLTRALRMTLHLRVLRPGHWHHVMEAFFKATGRCLAQALTPRAGEGPTSTKGVVWT